jgi:NAD(P)-dependent dehydrogenase (short-subunit alcohol dehydrogenase family)
MLEGCAHCQSEDLFGRGITASLSVDTLHSLNYAIRWRWRQVYELMDGRGESVSGGALAGKRVVITGASLGIGRAVALRLAREGARLVLGARHARALDETLALILASGAEAAACPGSVADFAHAGTLVTTCAERYGGIDVLASELARGVTGQVFWGSGGYIGRFLENGQEVLATMDHTAEPPWRIADLAAALGLGQRP